MSTTHESIFSYNVSRPYPFKWFTPVAVLGCVVGAALFSFLNFASNGYELVVKKSSSPNDTISENRWLEHWPSFLTSKIQPRCQDADIHVNTQLFTNQTTLTYTLTGVWRDSADDGKPVVLPSLVYHNNLIEQCTIDVIEIDFEALDRGANQIAYSEWGVTVRAYFYCMSKLSDGYTKFNLSTTYDYIPQTISTSGLLKFLGTDFLNRDKDTGASLYWGESLMSAYWAALAGNMQMIRENATYYGIPGIRKGTISMTPNDLSIFDITDLHFFGVDYRFIIDRGSGTFDVVHPGLYDWSHDVSYLDGISAYPNIWVLADSLAKSTYSTIFTDLGQTSFKSNILTNPAALKIFTSILSTQFPTANVGIGPLTKDYDTMKNYTGPLGVTPSVFSTSYICQVPQLKSGGNLFVAILIADLVLLQALWVIFKLVTDNFLLPKAPDVRQDQEVLGHQTNCHTIARKPVSRSSERPGTLPEQFGLDNMVSRPTMLHGRTDSSQEPLLR